MAHDINHTCNGCSACMRQCPVEAISGVKNEMFSIDADVCIDCHVCGWICPVDAVSDQQGIPIRRLPRDQRPRPLVNSDLCNGCSICVSYCPFDALGVVGPHHAGVSYLENPLVCVSCGECAEACIKRAIAMVPLDLRDFDPHQQRAKILEYLRSDA